MHTEAFLGYAFVYLLAAVVAVPLFKRLGLGSVLGYLAAGSLVGPSALELFTNVQGILHFAELGVVFLLFIIGLELQPRRLWALRKPLVELGLAQVLACTLIFGGAAWALGQPPGTAFIVGFCLSLSSTAFVLQILSERGQMTSEAGRSSFSILLFQDLAAIPALALVPLLAAGPNQNFDIMAVLKALGLVIALVFGGRYLTRPLFRAVASARNREVFTAMALLIVIGVGLLMQKAGLSMALGAFLAGVLLADSEYRHELESDIEPFKGLLLGLFFMGIGMSVDYGLLLEHPLIVLGLTAGFVVLKILVVTALGRVNGQRSDSALNLGILLSQGGEFAFVLFGATAASGLVSAELSRLLVLVVTLSMVSTPLLVVFWDKVLRPRALKAKPAPEYDRIEDNDRPVIIAGFGRFGQIFGRLLRTQNIGFTALDHDPTQIDVVRRFGAEVYYGDASRLDLLEAAGAAKARFLILAVDDVEASVRTARLVKEHFPKLKIFARARNRQHVYDLLDLGVHAFKRETFDSALSFSEQLLVELGIPLDRARDVTQRFGEMDAANLLKQHAVHHDPNALVDLSKLAAQQLSEALRADQTATKV